MQDVAGITHTCSHHACAAALPSQGVGWLAAASCPCLIGLVSVRCAVEVAGLADCAPHQRCQRCRFLPFCVPHANLTFSGGAQVIVAGVVTASFQGAGAVGIGGFFVQTPDADVDANDSTSEGARFPCIWPPKCPVSIAARVAGVHEGGHLPCIKLLSTALDDAQASSSLRATRPACQ